MSVSAISAPAAIPVRIDRAVGLWLFLIAAMIGLMVVVGGLTRLTGSGLSISEWQPVTGVLPPLSDAAWQAEFAKYQGSPQYELLNRGMGLAGFKTIYWWEWTHRLLGRLRGAGRAGLVDGGVGPHGKPRRGEPVPASGASGPRDDPVRLCLLDRSRSNRRGAHAHRLGGAVQGMGR